MHCFKRKMTIARAKMKGCWAIYSTSLKIRYPMHHEEWHRPPPQLCTDRPA